MCLRFWSLSIRAVLPVLPELRAWVRYGLGMHLLSVSERMPEFKLSMCTQLLLPLTGRKKHDRPKILVKHINLRRSGGRQLLRNGFFQNAYRDRPCAEYFASDARELCQPLCFWRR